MKLGPGDLTHGRLPVRLFVFGLPLALGAAFHGLFNAIDLVIVGHLRPGSIAAVSVASVVNTIPMLIFNGICNVVVALVARGTGARDKKMVHDVAWESFWLALV